MTDIIEQALRLPRAEREVILREIAASLDTDQPANRQVVEKAWANELRARRDDIVNGRVQGLGLEDVIAAGRAKLRST